MKLYGKTPFQQAIMTLIHDSNAVLGRMIDYKQLYEEEGRQREADEIENFRTSFREILDAYYEKIKAIPNEDK